MHFCGTIKKMADRGRYNPSVSLKKTTSSGEGSPSISEELFQASRRERESGLSKDDQKANYAFDGWKSTFFRLLQDVQLVSPLSVERPY